MLVYVLQHVRFSLYVVCVTVLVKRGNLVKCHKMTILCWNLFLCGFHRLSLKILCKNVCWFAFNRMFHFRCMYLVCVKVLGKRGNFVKFPKMTALCWNLVLCGSHRLTLKISCKNVCWFAFNSIFHFPCTWYVLRFWGNMVIL